MKAILLPLFLLFLSQLPAQTLHIRPVDGAITIDGKVDEAAWEKAEMAGHFRQTFPSDTVEARSHTEVRLAYDDKFLYVSAICWDSLPGPYVMQSLKRDFSFPVNDAFGMVLDAFNDKTTGLSFSLNPFGVQRDGLLESGGQFGVTTSWDGKWYGESFRFEGGWSCEMAIPFKTLRFPKDGRIWHINFARNDLKRNETSTWQRVQRNFNVSHLAFTGILEWDSPPKRSGSNIALIPYTLGSFGQDHLNDAPDKWKGNAGLDAKLAVTPALNLDLTINPDFSQVEVDQQQVNLDRFELFFPERRVFFLENSDLFANLGKDETRPFFSRRIGLNAPILAGLRMSGKLGSDWRLGIMNLQTEGVSGIARSQNYTAAVIERRVLARSGVTAFLLNRRAFTDLDPVLEDFSRVCGLEFAYRSKNGRLASKIYAHQAFTTGTPSDAGSYGITNSYGTSKISLSANAEYVGGNYAADMGYAPRLLRQVDGETPFYAYGRLTANAQRRFFFAKKPGRKLDFLSPELDGSFVWYRQPQEIEGSILGALKLQWLNASYVRFSTSHVVSHFLTPFRLPATNVTLPIGQHRFTLATAEWVSDKRKRLFGELRVAGGSYYSGKRFSVSGLATFRKQPWGVFGVTFFQQWLWYPFNEGPVSLTLLGPQFEIAFTRNIFLTTFLQYNTQARNFNINARFQWRFAPLSDIFLVYTDNYDTEGFASKTRGLVLKVNYWLSL